MRTRRVLAAVAVLLAIDDGHAPRRLIMVVEVVSRQAQKRVLDLRLRRRSAQME